MPHATEGQLHAYLDGALAAIDPDAATAVVDHVASCPDCSARLDEARALRDDSHALLDAALGSAIEPPPFETLLERAAEADTGLGSSTSPSQRRPGPERLAWAATVAIALGAGWFGHALLRSGEGSLAMRSQQVPVDPPAETNPALLEDAAMLEEAASTEFSVVADELVALDQAERENNEIRAELSDADARDRATPGAGPDDVAAAPLTTPALDRLEASEQTNRRSEALAAQGEVEQQAANAPVTVGEVQTREADLREAGLRDATRGRSSSADVAKAAADFADNAAGSGALLDPGVYRWRVVDQLIAEDVAGGPIARVPDLEVLEYGVAGDGGTQHAGLRQRLPGGEILELIGVGSDPDVTDQRNAAISERFVERRALDEEPLRRDVLGADRPETETPTSSVGLIHMWIEVDGKRIQASAAVAPDSLRALLLRIRGP